MKISRKVAFLILFVALIFSTIIAYLQHSETEKIRFQLAVLKKEKGVLLEKATNVLGKSLYNYAYDYTYWDEMVNFVKNPSKDWAYENIDLTLDVFNADAAWVINADYDLIHTVNTYNNDKLKSLIVSKEILSSLTKNSYFNHFFIESELGLMEIRIAPIQPGMDFERITKPFGYFIVGRFWDGGVLKELQELTQTEIKLESAKTLQKDRLVDTKESVVSYLHLKGYNNKTIVSVASKAVPIGIRESIKVSSNQFIIIVVFGLLLIFILILFAYKYIINPLNNISNSLSKGSIDKLENLMHTSDEFGVLARLISEFYKQKESLIIEINDKKKIEENLIHHQELLTTLIDAMPDIVTFKDGNGKWLKTNSFNLELFDLKNVDYYGKKDSDLAIYSDFYREAFLACEDSDEVAWKSEKISRGEETIPKPNGTELVFDIIKVPLFYPDGSRKGLVVIGRDISLRKNSEKALKESEEKYRKIFENIQDIFYQTDLEGNIVEISPSISRYAGYQPEELIGKNFNVLCENPSERDNMILFLDRMGEIVDYEMKLKHKNGSIIFMSINCHYMYNFEGRKIGIEGSVRDATERKMSERELLIAKDKAEESEKLKSEFLAQMSHEIRTPINAVLSFSSLIRSELEGTLEEDLETAFDLIKRAGRRIIRTIDLILNMSEIQTGTYDAQFKLIDLYDDIILKNYEELKHYAKEKNLDLAISKRTNQTYIIVDEYTINQIVNNLVDNAIKYTVTGNVEINLFTNERQQTVIEVKDSGIGISPQYMKNLFTAFTQEEQGYTRKYEGNGLGLALVKKYCELNGASIDVESEKGKGSTFRVVFSK